MKNINKLHDKITIAISCHFLCISFYLVGILRSYQEGTAEGVCILFRRKVYVQKEKRQDTKKKETLNLRHIQ